MARSDLGALDLGALLALGLTASDAVLQVIREYGLLNTVVAEALGSGANDPDVEADVAKYVSVFGANERQLGMAFPGTFALDREGRVIERFFEENYQDRNTSG